MIKIQVLGRGMIPRGYGLAPRMTPFNADLQTITTIMNTPGLTVRYINPETGSPCPLDRKNVKKVWDKYRDWVPEQTAAPQTTPHVPEKPVVPQRPTEPVVPVKPSNSPVVESPVSKVAPTAESKTPVEPVKPSSATKTDEHKAEDSQDEKLVVKPITNNNQNHNNNKK